MKNIHIIAHTHWDREWYRSSEAFLLRLVHSVDQILETLESNPDFPSYTLDGQFAIIEDYLKVKPQNSLRIKKLVEAGRLFIGPWYIQPDLNLVSGESLIRNILIGKKASEQLGGAMPLGWIPDAFGQIEDVPQLFKSFDFKGIFVWRGFDYDMLEDALFEWGSPNGASLPAVHFPLGYGAYRYFPETLEAIHKDFDVAFEGLDGKFESGEYLFMQGSDHARIQDNLPTVIAISQRYLETKGYRAVISNPLQFLEASLANKKQPLKYYCGEARSPKLGRIHAGITSTRMDIKADMRYYERVLAEVIEPMSVMMKQLGSNYSQELVNYFWKIVFKNQFHDSIYSSSPETVNQSVENRLLSLRHGLNEAIWLNHRYLMKSIDLDGLNEKDEIITIFNTLPVCRKMAKIQINGYFECDDFIIEDANGEQLPFLKLNQNYHKSNEIEEYTGIFHLNDEAKSVAHEIEKQSIIVTIPEFDAMSYKVLKIIYTDKKAEFEQSTDLFCEGQKFGNQFLAITIAKNGTLTVENRETGELYSDILLLEDRLDDGDEYNYSPTILNSKKTTNSMVATIEKIEDNASFISWEIGQQFNFTSEEDEGRIGTTCITTIVKLFTGSKTLEFTSRINNTADNHMVRVLFPGKTCVKTSLAQNHFGTVKRANDVDNSMDILNKKATELQLPIYTLNNYVMKAGDDYEFAILSKTVSEYEIYEDKTIAITLLRAVGDLGKVDLLTRPGRASGYHLKTPSSQMKMQYEVEYAMSFVGQEQVNYEVAMYQTPLNARHIKTIKQYSVGCIAWEGKSLFELDERLTMLATKQSEDGQQTILRFCNFADSSIEQAEIKIDGMYREAFLLNSSEEKIMKLEIRDNKIIFESITEMTFLTIGLA